MFGAPPEGMVVKVNGSLDRSEVKGICSGSRKSNEKKKSMALFPGSMAHISADIFPFVNACAGLQNYDCSLCLESAQEKNPWPLFVDACLFKAEGGMSQIRRRR